MRVLKVQVLVCPDRSSSGCFIETDPNEGTERKIAADTKLERFIETDPNEGTESLTSTTCMDVIASLRPTRTRVLKVNLYSPSTSDQHGFIVTDPNEGTESNLYSPSTSVSMASLRPTRTRVLKVSLA